MTLRFTDKNNAQPWTNMLPPFQIRQLRASENPDGPDLGDDFTCLPTEVTQLATVRISESEYDAIIAQHPHAMLTYMDEDDGDMMTVSCCEDGSSSRPTSFNIDTCSFRLLQASSSENAWKILYLDLPGRRKSYRYKPQGLQPLMRRCTYLTLNAQIEP